MAKIPVYKASDKTDMGEALERSKSALVAASAIPRPKQITVAESTTLIGIDKAVYRQIQANVNSENKRHIMFYGPPGTGKTELARHVASLAEVGYTLVTGSADWTSQDLIGGYQPVGGGKIEFIPGIMLRMFDRPFIIDELNRCDIDKVLGPMFTVLSNQKTTLPYRVDVTDKNSEQYQILGTPQRTSDPAHFAPGPDWRIIATINTVDKSSLYQMSYALSRRFAWIFIDVPENVEAFLREFLSKRRPVAAGSPIALAAIWDAVNAARPLGPAPFIDMVKQCINADPAFEFSAPVATNAVDAYVDAFEVHVLPMLDGVKETDMGAIHTAVINTLGLPPADARATSLWNQMKSIAL